MRITPNFYLDEFVSHDGDEYPAPWITERLVPLCETLQALRDFVGAPVSIISGYRSPAWNARIGGAGHSQHVEGRAADVRVAGVTPAEVHGIVLALHKGGKMPHLGGLGVYTGWCHLDVRPPKPDGTLAMWTGKGVGSDEGVG